jgi:hypothetical protein
MLLLSIISLVPLLMMTTRISSLHYVNPVGTSLGNTNVVVLEGMTADIEVPPGIVVNFGVLLAIIAAPLAIVVAPLVITVMVITDESHRVNDILAGTPRTTDALFTGLLPGALLEVLVVTDVDTITPPHETTLPTVAPTGIGDVLEIVAPSLAIAIETETSTGKLSARDLATAGLLHLTLVVVVPWIRGPVVRQPLIRHIRVRDGMTVTMMTPDPPVTPPLVIAVVAIVTPLSGITLPTLPLHLTNVGMIIALLADLGVANVMTSIGST